MDKESIVRFCIGMGMIFSMVLVVDTFYRFGVYETILPFILFLFFVIPVFVGWNLTIPDDDDD